MACGDGSSFWEEEVGVRIRIRIRTKPTPRAVPAPISGSGPGPVMDAGRLASSASRTSRASQNAQSTKAENPLQVPARRPGPRGGDACMQQLPRQMQRLLCLCLSIVVPDESGAEIRDRRATACRLRFSTAHNPCPLTGFSKSKQQTPRLTGPGSRCAWPE